MRFPGDLFCFLFAFSLPVFCQTLGQITGEVQDPSGSVIVGAVVTAINQGTNGVRTTTTNETGVYAIPSLQPAIYNLKVEKPGFRTMIRNDVQLEVQQTARVDFTLQVGQVNEVVEVSGSGALLTTENATVGTVIENKRIVELPLNGRNFLQLVSLSPNVSFLSGNRISISGQRIGFNRYTLDGGENTDVQTNTYTFLPSIDALQEFKVQSGIYPAEFGRAASQINVSTRSGTNEYHGALFEFLRNDKLDAKNYAFTTFRPPKDPFRWNQYGFSLAGPVSIPKIFNGKNRLFFMSNFEGFRDRKQLRMVADVPSSAMRDGNFSEISSRLFDPAARAGVPGSITAQPFPGNVIPRNRINAISIKLLEFYPEPNVNTPGLVSNYQAGESRRIDKDQFIQRIDFVESSSSTWFGRYSWADELQLTPGLKLSGSQTLNKPWQAMISNTRILSPNIVNEFRFTYSKFSNTSTGELAFKRDVMSELKIPGVLPQAPAAWGTPDVSVAGFSAFGAGGGPSVTNNHVFQWVDNISWTRGKHSLRFGAEVRRDRYNTSQYSFSRGQFIFEGVATQNPASRAGTGAGFADYLLSYTKQDRAAVAQAFAKFRATSQYYYIDDTWKVRPNLTLNIGLRYENTPPWFDASGNFMNLHLPFFDTAPNQDRSRHPTLVRIGSGDFYQGVLLRFNPAIQVARDGRLGDRLVYTDFNDFAPRLGIAWSPTSRWTVRTGTGIFYSQDIGTPRSDLSRNLAGYRTGETDADFPDLTFDQPFRNLGSTVQVDTPSILANNPQRRTAYTMQWLFNVQRELDKNTVVEAGYIGSATRKLEHYRSFNYALPSPTGSIQSRLPYPEFGRLYYVDAMGKADYQSMALKAQRRFSQGFTYLAAFTWSKAMDLGSGIRTSSTDVQFPQNEFCMQCEWGPSFFDTKLRFVNSTLYELPFGRGHHYFGRDVGKVLLGGWEIGSILTLQTGIPMTIMAGVDQANSAHQYQRPSATGQASGLPRSQQDPQRFFNTAAFALPPFGTLGNLGRNNVLGPGTISWDFSTLKNFPIHERQALQFRFEAFNLPNHPNWGDPDSTFVSRGFGTIRSTRTNMRELQFALKYIF